MTHLFMQAFTDLADQAVVLPLSALVGLTLLGLGRGRAALAWAVAVAGTLGVMLVLKVVFLACAPLWPVFGIRSPSGHTAAAAVLAGGLAWLIGIRRAWLAAMAVGVLVGTSRLVLGLHGAAEIVMGVVVGVLGALALAMLAGQSPSRAPRWPLAVAVMLAVAGFHGQRLRAEDGIAAVAVGYVRPLLGGACAPG